MAPWVLSSKKANFFSKNPYILYLFVYNEFRLYSHRERGMAIEIE